MLKTIYFRKQEIGLVIFLILLCSPLELRLFDSTNTYVIVNFNPVLLTPLIFILEGNRKIYYRKYLKENRILASFFIFNIMLITTLSFLNNSFGRIPLATAKFVIYIFISYYIWLKTGQLGSNKIIKLAIGVFTLFSALFTLKRFYHGEFFGFKDTYWFISGALAFYLCTDEFKIRKWLLAFLLIISLSRTAWSAFLMNIISKMSLISFAKTGLIILLSLIILVKLNIPQFTYYRESAEFLIQNRQEVILSDFNQVSEGLNLQNASDNYRIIEIFRSIDIIKKNFWIGVGYENYVNYSKKNYDPRQRIRLPHNEFLRYFAEGGVLYFLSLVILVYYVYKMAKKNNTSAIFFLALSMLMFTASTFLSLFFLLTAKNLKIE